MEPRIIASPVPAPHPAVRHEMISSLEVPMRDTLLGIAGLLLLGSYAFADESKSTERATHISAKGAGRCAVFELLHPVDQQLVIEGIVEGIRHSVELMRVREDRLHALADSGPPHPGEAVLRFAAQEAEHRAHALASSEARERFVERCRDAGLKPLSDLVTQVIDDVRDSRSRKLQKKQAHP